MKVMFKAAQLRELIIQPTLKDLVMYSPEAEELLVFTCAVESGGGTYLKQLNGPALGIYQMEPATYNDLWQNFIAKKSGLLMMLLHNFDVRNMPPEDKLIYDLRYATALCRIFYARIQAPLPPANDPQAIWEYYKKYYNTYLGAANEPHCIYAYKNFIA
jgi:hypothetical protein